MKTIFVAFSNYSVSLETSVAEMTENILKRFLGGKNNDMGKYLFSVRLVEQKILY